MSFKHFVIRAIILGWTFLSISCAFHSRSGAPEKADVILKAVPISSKVILAGSSADAVEVQAMKEGHQLRYIVQFKVENVQRGQFTEKRRGGPSELQQAREAAQDRNLWQLLTFDYVDPNERVPQGWVSIAVRDPEQSFGIISGEDLPKRAYRLYLKRSDDRPDSYYLLHAE